MLKSENPFEAIFGDAMKKVASQFGSRHQNKIIDVGAGGFVGDTTTKYLIKQKHASIEAIELNPERAQLLADKFKKSIRVTCGDFLEHDFGADAGSYDLVVLDLDSSLIPDLYESWIPNKVYDLLRPGGFVIVLCFGTVPDHPTTDFPLSEEVRQMAEKLIDQSRT